MNTFTTSSAYVKRYHGCDAWMEAVHNGVTLTFNFDFDLTPSNNLTFTN